jgi:hypothetical protein
VESFNTRFNTGIVVQFGCDELLELGNIMATIEDTFQVIVNGLYEVDPDNCNPEFRLVQSVQATIDVNITTGANSTGSLDERMLQITTEFPTASPSVLNVPTQSPSTAFSIGDSITVLLYISGVCIGCPNGFQLSNQLFQAVESCRLLGSCKTAHFLDPSHVVFVQLS